MKPVGARFSCPEQAELARLGRTVVVTSAEEALAVCKRVDERMRGLDSKGGCGC